MIRQRIDIGRYGWRVWVYYAKDCYYVEEIVRRLEEIGCRGRDLCRAQRNLRDCALDTGLTYSNFGMRETVMVVGLASSAEQYEDSIAHERQHLVSHICEACGIDSRSEECAYLVGEIARRMHRVAHRLTCECCRSSDHVAGHKING